MKNNVVRWREWLAALTCGAAVLAGAGCASRELVRERVFDEIYRNRQAAYEAWKRARDGKKEEQVVLRDEKMGVAAAVLLAMGNNKELKAIREQKENAAGRVLEARGSALPRLDVDGRYTRQNRPTFSQANSYAADLVLSQAIFHGGAIEAGIRGAQLYAYLTDEQIAGVVQDVVYQTRLGYADVLLAQELVQVSDGDLKLAKAHLADVEKKKAAGVVSQYDVLRASVDVSNVEAQLIERQNNLHLATTRLFKSMGVSQESRVQLTDALVYKAVATDLEASVKEGYRERPELRQAELAVRSNHEALVQAQAGFLPTLDAKLTYAFGKPDPRDPTRNDWDSAWAAGLTLAWPLFDGYMTRGRVRQAEANLRKSVVELAGAEEQVLLDVKQALLSLEDADKFVKSQVDNLERAKEALRLAKAGYDAGVKTEIEMLDARQAVSQTQALYYQAVYKYEAAKLSLERSTGSLRRAQLEGAPK